MAYVEAKQRHELGFSRTEARFPTKGTCLPIYSRCINTELTIEEVLHTTFPWCSAWDKVAETRLTDLLMPAPTPGRARS